MTDPQTEKLIREALEEGENKIADFNKDLAQFLEDTAGENILQIILRGHLYIERQLTSFLELALKEPREVIKERTSYGNKLSLAYAIGILSKDDKDTCKKIGDIRNSYAHKWGFELTEDEFDKLISTFTGDLKELYIYNIKNNVTLPSRLAIAIGVIFYHLRILTEQYEGNKKVELIKMEIGEEQMKRLASIPENQALLDHIKERITFNSIK